MIEARPGKKLSLSLESSPSKELSALFYLSFRYSQGEPDLQKNLFKYLAAEGYLEGLPIGFLIPFNVLKGLKPPHQHTDIGKKTFDPARFYNIYLMWKILREVKNFKYERFNDKYELISTIAPALILRDLIYQQKERSRISPSDKINSPDSITDPYASFIRRFALGGANTGHIGFTHVFKEVGNLIRNEPIRISELAMNWQARHPGHIFYTPPNPNHQ